MNSVPAKDREILRALAEQHMEYATSPRNDEILKQWKALEEGRRDTPTVRMLFSNFPHEVITPRMKCESPEARDLEWIFRNALVGRELFDDDTPISPTFDVEQSFHCTAFGTKPHITHTSGLGHHIDPVISDLEEEFDKLKGGSYYIDRETPQARMELAEEIFGDILKPRRVMGSIGGGLAAPLVQLMGMENFYMAMYDCPDKVHEAMDLACTLYENFYDYLEKEKVLLPTVGISPINQESFAFNHELPSENVTKTTQIWGFQESQETTAVSPETFGEFIFPYQDRLVKRYGLLTYGCCERVDAIWPDYLSKWKNLRKLSVSPFNNEAQVGEYLRGTNVVYYSKPRAEYITVRGAMDEDAIRANFKTLAENSSGCLLEVAQREAGTIYGEAERGRRYVELAKETLNRYWKP